MPFVNVIAAAATSTTDWDTHEIGAALSPRLNTSGWVLDYDHQFPPHSGYYIGGINGTVSTGTLTNYRPQSAYATPANLLNTPPYVALWVSAETDAVGGRGHPDAGWYVFARNGYTDGTAEGSTPSSNGRALYSPHAWTAGISNDDGYFGQGGSETFPFFWVFLDDYTDGTGSGGVDHWSDPYDWSSPKYTMTATIGQASSGAECSLSSVSESGATADWEPHTGTPFRGSSTQVFILMKASSGGAFNGSGNDFFADTKLQHFRLRNTTSGSEYDCWNPATTGLGHIIAQDQYYSAKFGDSSGNEPWGSGALFYLRFNFPANDGQAAFDKFSDGDTIKLELFYTDDT